MLQLATPSKAPLGNEVALVALPGRQSTIKVVRAHSLVRRLRKMLSPRERNESDLVSERSFARGRKLEQARGRRLHSGWLLKPSTGMVNRAMGREKKKFCVLTDDPVFCWFEDADASQQKGSVRLNVDGVEVTQNDDNLIIKADDGATFKFKASSQEDARQWKQQISAAVATIPPALGSPSVSKATLDTPRQLSAELGNSTPTAEAYMQNALEALVINGDQNKALECLDAVLSLQPQNKDARQMREKLAASVDSQPASTPKAVGPPSSALPPNATGKEAHTFLQKNAPGLAERKEIGLQDIKWLLLWMKSSDAHCDIGGLAQLNNTDKLAQRLFMLADIKLNGVLDANEFELMWHNLPGMQDTASEGEEKFRASARTFVFGARGDWQRGLEGKISMHVRRSIQKECTLNAGGKYKDLCAAAHPPASVRVPL